MPAGNRGEAWVMAASMSGGTSVILRLRLNWRVICVKPSVLIEVIESRPSMVENWRSSGVATAEAIVSGLPPGRLAVTTTVGKSTLGGSLHQREREAVNPQSRAP